MKALITYVDADGKKYGPVEATVVNYKYITLFNGTEMIRGRLTIPDYWDFYFTCQGLAVISEELAREIILKMKYKKSYPSKSPKIYWQQ